MEHEDCKSKENIDPKNSKHNIIIWYTNADSLPNKLTELKERPFNTDSVPSIICITEVKPKNSRFNLVP